MRRIGLGALLASLLLVPLLISAGNPLLARIEALEAELNQQPILVDANGVVVGTLFDIKPGNPVESADVLLDFEGFPLFPLTVSVDTDDQLNQHFSGTATIVYFTSADCSGTGYMSVFPTEPFLNLPFPQVFLVEDGSDVTYLNSASGSETITAFSRLRVSGVCDPIGPSTIATLAPAIRVTPMEGRFTPPFRVVTRGDLLAE